MSHFHKKNILCNEVFNENYLDEISGIFKRKTQRIHNFFVTVN
jgi:hypothetical protein